MSGARQEQVTALRAGERPVAQPSGDGTGDGTGDGKRADRDPAVIALAWASMLVASALPLVVVTELTGSRAPLWLPVAQVVVVLGLLGMSAWTRRFGVLVAPLRWLLAMAVGWHLVLGTVTGTEAWQAWQHSVPWVARGAAVQLLLLFPTLLLVLLGPGRLGRAALRLAPGDDGARAGAGVFTAGRRPSWRRLGTVWALLITVGTTSAMALALGSRLGDLEVLLWSLPAIAILAAMNTFNEEFGFRNVPLALLPEVVGRRQSLVLTGLLFGLAHYYGNPPAASGVLLATFLGILLAKSMLETGGSRWAWTIHWLQDVVIFSFLTLAWASLSS